jgi:hypothetical protein
LQRTLLPCSHRDLGELIRIGVEAAIALADGERSLDLQIY